MNIARYLMSSGVNVIKNNTVKKVRLSRVAEAELKTKKIRFLNGIYYEHWKVIWPDATEYGNLEYGVEYRLGDQKHGIKLSKGFESKRLRPKLNQLVWPIPTKSEPDLSMNAPAISPADVVVDEFGRTGIVITISAKDTNATISYGGNRDIRSFVEFDSIKKIGRIDVSGMTYFNWPKGIMVHDDTERMVEVIQ